MRLKYLTFSLLALSLTACSQHVIKTTSHTSSNPSTAAINGLNALYETSGFDYTGQFAIQSELPVAAKAVAAESTANKALDPAIEKQISQYLKTQGIQLAEKDRAALYQKIAEEQASYKRKPGSSGSAKMLQSVMNILNDMQFSYNGSVHYKERLASMNLNMEYQKPTLQVKAQLPMIFDLKDYRFYSNFFALMPYMVNRESQNSYAYIDLSKFKGEFERVNIRLLADYLKEMNALPYVLAENGQIQSLALSSQDKKNGISRKIRYSGDVETLMLQLSMFDSINRDYLKNKVMGVTSADEANAAAAAAEDAADAAMAAAEGAQASSDDPEQQAYDSAERVAEKINGRLHSMMYHSDEHDHTQAAADVAEGAVAAAEEAEYVSAEATDATADAVRAAAEAVTEYDETQEAAAADEDSLTREACTALAAGKDKIPLGHITLCQDYYRINVLADPADTSGSSDTSTASVISALTRLEPVFEQYKKPALTSTQELAQIWQKHLPEIQEVLNSAGKKTPIVMDVSLDAAGRVSQFSGDIVWSDQDFGKIRILNEMQLKNYGRATSVNRQLMREAKSIEDVTRGSMLENMVGSFSRTFGTSVPAAAEEQKDSRSMEEHLNEIAVQTYKRTGSVLKAYQAAFMVDFAASQPEIVKKYTVSELGEIAEVYAYHFLENEAEKLPKKAQTRIEVLQKKHQLINSSQFDDSGYTVKRIVQEAVKNTQEQQKWTALKKQHKTQQALFAHYYIQLFSEDYEMNAEQKRLLKCAAEIMAQAFADDRKGKLSDRSVRNLRAEYDDYFDYDVYRKAYRDIVGNMKK